MIRALHPKDAAFVAALIRDAFAAIEPPLDPPPSALNVDEAAIRAHLASGGGGARHGDAGCILWAEVDGALHVSRLAVQPDARGRGIATSLLECAEQEARARGLPRLHLQVRLALDGNRRLFRRMGFIETGLHRHPGFDHPTFVSAEKRLA